MAKYESEIMIPDEVIMNKIYLIRGKKVMLDRDLAELYEIETKQLKRAVRRNINRFPEDFMFQLNKEELEKWRCQIVRIFVKMRELMASHNELIHNMEKKIELNLARHDEQIQLVFKYLKQLEQIKQQKLDQQNRKKVGFRRKDEH